MKKLIVIITLLFTLVSCQRELDFEPVTVIAPLLPDSNYLDRMLIVDVANDDTIDTYIVTYDAQKRVTRLYDSMGVNNGIQTFIDYQYFYNGTDSLPYKCHLEIQEDPAVPNFISTRYFFYDGSGNLVRDSVFGTGFYSATNAGRVTRYQYNGSSITAYSLDTTFSPNPPGFEAAVQTDTAWLTNGNITRYMHWYRSGALSTTVKGSTHTYDNNPSPWGKLSLFKPMLTEQITAGDYIHFYQKNNPLASRLDHFNWPTMDIISTIIHDHTGQYEYNGRGYPVRLAFSEQELYFYRTL